MPNSKTIICSSLFVLNTPSLVCQSTQAQPVVQLAEEYHQDLNLSGYLVSEKLDGIRALWTGEKLITRSGKVVHAPEWFTEKFA